MGVLQAFELVAHRVGRSFGIAEVPKHFADSATDARIEVHLEASPEGALRLAVSEFAERTSGLDAERGIAIFEKVFHRLSRDLVAGEL
jgi:hypothetical protein